MSSHLVLSLHPPRLPLQSLFPLNEFASVVQTCCEQPSSPEVSYPAQSDPRSVPDLGIHAFLLQRSTPVMQDGKEVCRSLKKGINPVPDGTKCAVTESTMFQGSELSNENEIYIYITTTTTTTTHTPLPPHTHHRARVILGPCIKRRV